MGGINRPPGDSWWDKIPEWMRPIIGISGMIGAIMLVMIPMHNVQQDQIKEKAKWHREVTLSDGRIFKVTYVNVYNAGFFADGESIVFMRTCDGGEITITGMATTEVRKVMVPCP